MFFNRSKKKEEIMIIEEKAKELRQLQKSDEIILPDSEIESIHSKVSNPEEGCREIDIKLIERESPLSAHFVKVEICNDIMNRVFNEDEKVDDVFAYNKKGDMVNYVSLEPMKAFNPGELISVKNKHICPIKVCQLYRESLVSYLSKAGSRCNIKIKTIIGQLSEN